MKLSHLCLAGSLLLSAAGAASAAEVSVTLTGVQDRGGNMLVSLQSRDQFMKPGDAAGAVQPATGGTMTLMIHDVPPGDYAVLVMHDEDNNWTLTMKDGRPGEGMANTGGAISERTTFDDLKITVPAEGLSLTLPITYP